MTQTMRSLNNFQISGYVNWHAEQGNMYTVLVGVADDYFSKENKNWVDRKYGIFVRFSGRVAEGLGDRINIGDQVIVQGKITVYEKNGNSNISLIGDDLIIVARGNSKEDSNSKNGEKPASKQNTSKSSSASDGGNKKRVETIKNSDVEEDLWGDDNNDENQPW